MHVTKAAKVFPDFACGFVPLWQALEDAVPNHPLRTLRNAAACSSSSMPLSDSSSATQASLRTGKTYWSLLLGSIPMEYRAVHHAAPSLAGLLVHRLTCKASIYMLAIPNGYAGEALGCPICGSSDPGTLSKYCPCPLMLAKDELSPLFAYPHCLCMFKLVRCPSSSVPLPTGSLRCVLWHRGPLCTPCSHGCQR